MNAAYKLSFTGVSLALTESVRVAELYAQLGDWERVREQALAANLLQSRAASSAKRVFQEIPPRLQELSPAQLELLIHGSLPEQKALLWLAVCKRYAFIREFALEVLRAKFAAMDYSLAEADYEVFFRRKADRHEELNAISETTKAKLRSNLFRIMREADIINLSHEINPVVLSSRLMQALAPDAPVGFLIFPTHLSNTEG